MISDSNISQFWCDVKVEVWQFFNTADCVEKPYSRSRTPVCRLVFVCVFRL